MTNIFIVDDSALTRAAVKKTLSQEGFNILSCHSGYDCLEKVETYEDHIHLFILDVNMPEMDGITLIKELRKIQKTKYTPILMLTTESSQEQKMKGKKAGASGWFVKPFQADQLIKISKRFARNSSRKISSLKKDD